ncbi:MAG: ExbD/TolR family protein [Flavobacteriales bacterium]
MRNKTTPGLSAGSMADIAFLLLIFFLVATTVDDQQGFKTVLPPLSDAPPMLVEEGDVLAFNLDKLNGITYKGESIQLPDLEELIFQFYQNGGVLQEQPGQANMPLRQWVTDVDLQRRLRESELEEDERLRLKQKLTAVQTVGAYKELPAKAFVMFTFDSNLNYDQFIAIQEVFNRVLCQLRDNMAQSKAGVKFNELNVSDASQKKLKESIRTLFPKRYVESIKTV